MTCPQCGTEMRIISGRNAVEGDTSPGEVTRVWRVQDIRCINRRCTAHNKPTEQKVLLFESGADE